MALLFQPLKLNDKTTLKNRIVVSPMCQYSSVDGFAADWHLVHLGARAIGGASAIIQEATAISAEGRISYGDLGLWKDEHIDGLKKITGFIKAQNAVPGIQLAHAGRKASTERPWIGRQQLPPSDENGWQTVSSSNQVFNQGEQPPLALSLEEIQQCIADFGAATKRAIEAGYEIIEIHAAHGYLIHQFLSPLINSRRDEYGGSFENRIRFLLEIVEAVKKQLRGQSLWVRISATDWAEGGWDLEESIELARILKTKAVDVIDVSSGGAVAHQKVNVETNYQLPFANAIKKNSQLITGTVGLIVDAHQAEEILQNQEADFVLIGREFLRDPYFPLHAASALGTEIEWPSPYERAKK